MPDDLRGYTEQKGDEKVHEEGILESFKLSQDAATLLIMQARVKAGWIDASALEPEPELDADGNPVEPVEEDTADQPEAELTAADVFES